MSEATDRVVRIVRGLSNMTTRVAAPGLPLHNAAKADEETGKAYVHLVDLKLGFDRIEEIPSQYDRLYREIMNGMDALRKARQITTNVRELVRRMSFR